MKTFFQESVITQYSPNPFEYDFRSAGEDGATKTLRHGIVYFNSFLQCLQKTFGWDHLTTHELRMLQTCKNWEVVLPETS